MGSPRWLNDEEQRVWRAYLGSTGRLFALLEAELQKDSGLSHAHYEVMVRLSEAPDRRLRMSELAHSSMFTRSGLSHAVDRLEKLGWIRRENCPTDRRGAFAVLTDDGFAALEAAAPEHVECVRRHVFDQLTESEQAQLKAISQKLLKHLESAH
jgi:DNA-binding MarR family transcriptional regulator